MFQEEGQMEFSDIIKSYVLMMVDFGTEEAGEVVNNHMINYLVEMGYSAQDIRQLKYTIKVSGDLIVIKADNLITGLWFSDVYPEVIPDVTEDSIIIDDVEYRYANKGTIKKIKHAK